MSQRAKTATSRPGPHYAEEFENAIKPVRFGFLAEEHSGRSTEECHGYRNIIVFEKLHFKNVLRSHRNSKPACSNSAGLKNVFREKLRTFSSRILVWTEFRPNRCVNRATECHMARQVIQTPVQKQLCLFLLFNTFQLHSAVATT